MSGGKIRAPCLRPFGTSTEDGAEDPEDEEECEWLDRCHWRVGAPLEAPSVGHSSLSELLPQDIAPSSVTPNPDARDLKHLC